MKLARKAARHASADQLSFLFTEAASVAQPLVKEVRQRDRPARAHAAPVRERPKPARKLIREVTSVVGQEDRRLTVDEAAHVLCVSVKTLEAWRRLGKGPAFVKLGRSVRYTMRALDQFTRERTVRNSAEGRLLDARR
ncbi:MAG TPA: helix-turn-helix domain-containing protein [Candidatus Binatia bacterium]|nr:helix-turn-helix domain-containing protein [Candidatus Binatia bacterium]